MLDKLQGIHIETTNMCTLKCPRCSRTEFIKQFPTRWANTSLNLEHLKQFIDIDLTGKDIYLCSSYGDTIYYNQLFELVDYFKKAGANITISTNGSHRTRSWWEQLNQLLDHNDEIIFGIDGLPSNFTQYRINADWDSIATGIEVLRTGSVRLTWQYILFSFNENNVDEAKQLSVDMGFHKFILMDSDRWDNGTEWLTPNAGIVHEKSVSKIQWRDKSANIEIDPRCKKDNNMHFIFSSGYYTPCCYMQEHRFYYKTDFYKNRDQYDISKTTLSKVVDNLKDFYSTLEDAKLNYCTFNCPKL